MLEQKEVWKVIPGFPDYEVSSFGRVRSLERQIVCKNGVTKHKKGVLLKPGPSKTGHLTVVLGRGNTRAVHYLVMLAFVGERPFGFDVLHLDHNPGNNNLSNLRYGSRSENVLMDYEVGNRGLAKNVIATDLCGNKKEFTSVTSAAKFYNLSQPAISRLIKTGGMSRNSFIKFSYGNLN